MEWLLMRTLILTTSKGEACDLVEAEGCDGGGDAEVGRVVAHRFDVAERSGHLLVVSVELPQRHYFVVDTAVCLLHLFNSIYIITIIMIIKGLIFKRGV